ncbi:hypothetical protein A3F27_00030 [Candidatus Kaiserbacteria bacterium RIFCSPHIGHO2_12_FULL_53_13]|uniref:FCP1 homology domain-containing protein n=1 Tax=Candidatus Kaiserbacteria bacterium RIFCSPHIGHO2_12_FULL_53_13 TaxID=1798502 RepID=A0A1F6EC37_9BACT|nr:MAG: hypothetical protein A3F27_00030 [Candidatus Kaiserbacteria bacterium RIFCSPHIGHO2_12_FULL_53_13]OGG74281.1 MAG: hypothetical protein A3A37_03095 [Candidatus Kaiserbacteria bacterium RIFCSPLOWO2_01_FULL_52_36]
MYTTLLSDFSRVIIKPKDKNYAGALNPIHRDLTEKLGERYGIFDYFELNEKLLDFYRSLKAELSVNIFTTDILQNHPLLMPRLEPIFENIFSANTLGLSKKEPSAYLFIAEKLRVRPESIVYIDDQIKNVEAAQEAGLSALHYTDNDDEIIKEVSLLLHPEQQAA